MKIYESQAQAVQQTSHQAVRAEYQALPFEDQFRVPMFKALFIGGISAIFAGIVLWVVTAVVAYLWPALPRVQVVLGGVLLTFAYNAYAFFQKYESDAMYLFEQMTRRDIDGDGEVGPPKGATPSPAPSALPDVLRIAVDTSATSALWFGLPYRDRLPQFARAVLAGKPLSERNWIGRSNPFGDTEYPKLQEALVAEGFAVWRNPNVHQVGMELTDLGKQVLQDIARY